MYDLYSKFDIEQHKANYVNYLEVIILEDGEVEYAIPSHQEYLVKLACKKFNISREELSKRCPPEYYFDFLTWLCMQTNAVSVWTEFLVYYEINDAQLETLHKLYLNKLYVGKLPEFD